MDRKTKGMQCMATICSCLKYFGRAVVGVASIEDRMIITELVNINI